jgi:hypothetical protein
MEYALRRATCRGARSGTQRFSMARLKACPDTCLDLDAHAKKSENQNSPGGHHESPPFAKGAKASISLCRRFSLMKPESEDADHFPPD